MKSTTQGAGERKKDLYDMLLNQKELGPCSHPIEKLLWYDGALHCFACRVTWHKDFPEHAGKEKVWGVPDLPKEPEYQI